MISCWQQEANNMYKIAVITPCHNRTQFISECIQSVSLSNTFGICEIEHIIIDDASTDDTWNVIRQSKVPNITALRLTENKGPAFARNYAIGKCDTDFIFCLDSDDVLFQNSLFSLLTFALEKKADWVYGDVIRGDSELRYQIGKDFFGWNFKKIEDVLIAMFKNEHFFQHSSLFSKTAFDKAGRYDNTLHIEEEFDLFTRMLLCGYFPYYLPSPLYICRIHDNNISKLYSKNPKNHKEALRELYKKYKTEFQAILSKDSITSIEQAQGTW
jgi:glycosyltransferase involved in cell wall biosynthesis